MFAKIKVVVEILAVFIVGNISAQDGCILFRKNRACFWMGIYTPKVWELLQLKTGNSKEATSYLCK